MALFEYCLDDFWQRYHQSTGTLTYRDVAISPGSIGQVFKLPEDEIRERLDAYAEPRTPRRFSYRASAVQGLLSRRDAGNWDPLSTVYVEEG